MDEDAHLVRAALALDEDLLDLWDPSDYTPIDEPWEWNNDPCINGALVGWDECPDDTNTGPTQPSS